MLQCYSPSFEKDFALSLIAFTATLGKAERNDRLFAVPRRSHSEQGLPCAQ
jgi:hypothetical protein